MPDFKSMSNDELAEFVAAAGVQEHTKLACQEAADRLRKKKDCVECPIAASEAQFRRERPEFEEKCREAHRKQAGVLAETAAQNVRVKRLLGIAKTALGEVFNAYNASNPNSGYIMFGLAREALKELHGNKEEK